MAGRAKEADRPGRWLWRGLTLAWAGAAIWGSLKLHRESAQPHILRRDGDALRRASLGFPLPVMLAGTRVRHFRDDASGTHSLSFRLPGRVTVNGVHAYYAEYLASSGFLPVAAPAPASATEPLPDPPSNMARAFRQRDGFLEASVSVVTEPLRGQFHTVVVTVRPAAEFSPR